MALVDFTALPADDEDMESVGIFHAKTHLSELVERARKGEVIEITRHGKPVARLTAAEPAEAQQCRAEQAIARIRGIRQRSKLRREEVKSLIEEGRRY